MVNSLFVTTLAVGFTLLLAWSFKKLPDERWQILASVPISKDVSGHWRGVNLTFYGLLTANAYGAAVAILFVLLGAVSVPLSSTFAVAGSILMVCVPASKLVARLVEKKSYTFTIGGASFVGIVLAPWIITLIQRIPSGMVDAHIPMMPAMAALAISYALGEGLGRLACISFGCCYGKPLSQIHPVMRRIFENHCFVFSGKTKKIAYASGLDGEKVVPIQAITSVLYIVAGLIGIQLFLHSHFVAALILTIVVTQGWRAFSETLRADYRGDGKVSAYQIMGVIAIVYSLSLPLLFQPEAADPPDLTAGLGCIWNPAFLLFLYALRFGIFIYTGRSMVTGSTLSFHVHGSRT
jgi:prolipoprotein diacylglyceryltransferase